MNRVYCLYRVSTKGQVEQDDIPMQKQACRTFAEKMGWTICKEFLEKGISGFKVSANDRDAIQDLKAAAEKKEFDILLVFMFDRLGRIENETPFVLEWFVKSGIQVWSAKEGQQTFENDCDYLLNYIRFWQAGGESRKTSLRVKTRLGQLVEEGKFTGGTAMFGYKFVKSGVVTKKGRELLALEIVPEEAAVVQFIFYKTVEEGYGTYRLCNLINEQGYRTHSGAMFHPNTINRILRSHTYTGYFVRGGKKSGFIEELKIVDERVFDEAQKILASRSVTNTRKSNIAYMTKGAAMLGGNLFCAYCGAKMHAISYSDPVILADGTRKVYKSIRYICPNKARGRGACSGQGQYTSRKVDESVMEIVRFLLDTVKEDEKDEAIKRRHEQAVQSKKKYYAGLVKEYGKQQMALQKLIEEIGQAMIGESRFTMEVLNQSITLQKAKLEKLEKEIPQVLAQVNQDKDALESLDHLYEEFVGWADEFECASKERQKMIVCKLLKRIDISRQYNLGIIVNMDYGQFMERRASSPRFTMQIDTLGRARGC